MVVRRASMYLVTEAFASMISGARFSLDEVFEEDFGDDGGRDAGDGVEDGEEDDAGDAGSSGYMSSIAIF